MLLVLLPQVLATIKAGQAANSMALGYMDKVGTHGHVGPCIPVGSAPASGTALDIKLGHTFACAICCCCKYELI
jgi:hypothetical protein